jgi:hypothetical protein
MDNYAYFFVLMDGWRGVVAEEKKWFYRSVISLAARFVI